MKTISTGKASNIIICPPPNYNNNIPCRLNWLILVASSTKTKRMTAIYKVTVSRPLAFNIITYIFHRRRNCLILSYTVITLFFFKKTTHSPILMSWLLKWNIFLNFFFLLFIALRVGGTIVFDCILIYSEHRVKMKIIIREWSTNTQTHFNLKCNTWMAEEHAPDITWL